MSKKYIKVPLSEYIRLKEIIKEASEIIDLIKEKEEPIPKLTKAEIRKFEVQKLLKDL